MKETDLTRVHAGQPVDVKIDTYPGLQLARLGRFRFAGERRRVFAAARGKHLRQLGEGRAARFRCGSISTAARATCR